MEVSITQRNIVLTVSSACIAEAYITRLSTVQTVSSAPSVEVPITQPNIAPGDDSISLRLLKPIDEKPTHRLTTRGRHETHGPRRSAKSHGYGGAGS